MNNLVAILRNYKIAFFAKISMILNTARFHQNLLVGIISYVETGLSSVSLVSRFAKTARTKMGLTSNFIRKMSLLRNGPVCCYR
jgi:hypothetical protein